MDPKTTAGTKRLVKILFRSQSQQCEHCIQSSGKKFGFCKKHITYKTTAILSQADVLSKVRNLWYGFMRLKTYHQHLGASNWLRFTGQLSTRLWCQRLTPLLGSTPCTWRRGPGRKFHTKSCSTELNTRPKCTCCLIPGAKVRSTHWTCVTTTFMFSTCCFKKPQLTPHLFW